MAEEAALDGMLGQRFRWTWRLMAPDPSTGGMLKSSSPECVLTWCSEPCAFLPFFMTLGGSTTIRI